MNYLKIYYQLMANTADRLYNSDIHELHHIIPLHLGGSDHLLNIAFLTKKEHQFAHKLLSYYVLKRKVTEYVIPESGESRASVMQKLKSKVSRKVFKTPGKPGRPALNEEERKERERERKRIGAAIRRLRIKSEKDNSSENKNGYFKPDI